MILTSQIQRKVGVVVQRCTERFHSVCQPVRSNRCWWELIRYWMYSYLPLRMHGDEHHDLRLNRVVLPPIDKKISNNVSQIYNSRQQENDFIITKQHYIIQRIQHQTTMNSQQSSYSNTNNSSSTPPPHAHGDDDSMHPHTDRQLGGAAVAGREAAAISNTISPSNGKRGLAAIRISIPTQRTLK